MRRITFLRNPTSGRGSGRRDWPRVESLIQTYRSYWDVSIVKTQPGSIACQVQEALDHGAERVVACGGDGTIMQVASLMAGKDVPLAFLPLGTGNDLCRTLGFAGNLPLAVKTAFEGEARRIDMGRWRCQGCEGAFVNVAGTGFDAVVAERINQGYRYMRGTSAYLAAVLSQIVSYRPAQCRIHIDGTTIDTTVMLCAVANAKTYGGGMQIAPQAELSDGLLDVVIVEGVGVTEFLRAFPRVFKGTHLSHPKIKVLRGSSVSIESDQPLPVLADGENIGQTPVHFHVEPSVLTILTPP
jgi:diacylglycerol kinase (ATP)